MSLNYDTTKCDPPTPQNDNEAQARECLIWGTMATGINEITIANWPEVYARMCMIEKVNGPYRQIVPGKDTVSGDPIPVYITPAEVKRWIGMHTNASPKTRIQFMRWFKYSLDDMVKYAQACVEHDEEVKNAEVRSEVRFNDD